MRKEFTHWSHCSADWCQVTKKVRIEQPCSVSANRTPFQFPMLQFGVCFWNRGGTNPGVHFKCRFCSSIGIGLVLGDDFEIPSFWFCPLGFAFPRSLLWNGTELRSDNEPGIFRGPWLMVDECPWDMPLCSKEPQQFVDVFFLKILLWLIFRWKRHLFESEVAKKKSDSSPQSQARLQRLAEVGAVSGHSLRCGKAWEGFRWFRWFRWPRTQGIRWHGSKWRSQRLEHLTSWLTAFSVGSKSRLGVLGWWSFLDLWDTLTFGKCLSVWVFGFGCFYAKFALFTAKCRSFAKKTVYRIGFAKKSHKSDKSLIWELKHLALPSFCRWLPSQGHALPSLRESAQRLTQLETWKVSFLEFAKCEITKITKIYKMPILAFLEISKNSAKNLPLTYLTQDFT